jgi:hypothetical protein
MGTTRGQIATLRRRVTIDEAVAVRERRRLELVVRGVVEVGAVPGDGEHVDDPETGGRDHDEPEHGPEARAHLRTVPA